MPSTPKGHISLVRAVLLATACLLGMAALIIVPFAETLDRAASFAIDTRDKHLPEMLERQRTTSNVEKLGRYAWIVFASKDPDQRRKARLAAQVLTADAIFERDQGIFASVTKTYQDVRKIEEIRLRQDEDRLAIRALSSAADKNFIKLIDQLKQQKASSFSIIKAINEADIKLNRLTSLDNAKEMALAREDCKKALAAIDDASIPENTRRHKRALEDQFAHLYALVENYVSAEKLADSMNAGVELQIREISDALSLMSTASASEIASHIVEDSYRAKLTVTIGMYVLLALTAIVGLLFRAHLLLPILRSTSALDEAEKNGREVKLPKAWIYELQAIGDAVENLSRVLESHRETNTELERLSMQDSLTKVANRRFFEQSLAKEMSRSMRHGRPMALLFIDIDHFKLYNDHYGHIKGDECLKLVADALSKAMKRPGELFARIGGEEFAVILPETDLEGAATMASYMLEVVRELNQPHCASPAGESLTISVGATAGVPNLDTTPGQIMSAADKCLYRAKAEGRNTYRFAQFQAV